MVLTFIIWFINTNASRHVISVIMFTKSGKGNGILDENCVSLSAWDQGAVLFVKWQPIDFHWTPT